MSNGKARKRAKLFYPKNIYQYNNGNNKTLELKLLIHKKSIHLQLLLNKEDRKQLKNGRC